MKKLVLITIVNTLALGLLVGIPRPASGDVNFKFTTIDPPGSTSTAVNGNSAHAIAGQFDDAGGNTHGFVLSKGVYTTIDKPGAVVTTVNGISANDQLTGTYMDTDSMPTSGARAPLPRSIRPTQ